MRINMNSDIFFYDYLECFNINGLKELNMVSKGTVKLLFSSAHNANNFFKNNDFKKKKFKSINYEIFQGKFRSYSQCRY